MFAQISIVSAEEENNPITITQEDSGCYRKEYLVNGVTLSLPGCGPTYCYSEGGLYGYSCSCESEEKTICSMIEECSVGRSKVTCNQDQIQEIPIELILFETEKELRLFLLPKVTEDKNAELIGTISSNTNIHNSYFFKTIALNTNVKIIRIYLFKPTNKYEIHDITIINNKGTLSINVKKLKEENIYQEQNIQFSFGVKPPLIQPIC